jgi:hypothetical protein
LRVVGLGFEMGLDLGLLVATGEFDFIAFFILDTDLSILLLDYS